MDSQDEKTTDQGLDTLSSRQPVEPRRPAPVPGGPGPLIRLNLYKRGQGTPVRALVFVALAVMCFLACRWIYLMPATSSGWYYPVVPTGAAAVALAAVAAIGILLYRTVVRGRSDRELLRWGAMTGGLVLGAYLVKKLLVNHVLAGVDALQRPWIAAYLPFRWGHVVCVLAFLYGLWAIYRLVVNHPQRVDFLIETETELRKVAWPTRREYLGASVVVIVIVALVSMYLTAVDLILNRILSWLGIGF